MNFGNNGIVLVDRLWSNIAKTVGAIFFWGGYFFEFENYLKSGSRKKTTLVYFFDKPFQLKINLQENQKFCRL